MRDRGLATNTIFHVAPLCFQTQYSSRKNVIISDGEDCSSGNHRSPVNFTQKETDFLPYFLQDPAEDMDL